MANEKVQSYVIDVKFSESFKKLEKIYDKFKDVNVKNANALERAQKSIKRSALWLDEAKTDAEKKARADVKSAMANAKTADELKDQVAESRSYLRVNKKNTKENKKQNFLLQRMQSSSKQMAGNMVTAFAVGAGVSAVTRVGQDLEAAQIAMDAAAGSAEEGAIQFAFARQEAKRLGLDIVNTTKDYSKLFAAGRGKVPTEELQNIFLGVAEAATVMGLSAEDSSGVLRALQQMMSKGKIQAEELRGQLGDRMSPAFRLMAEAMGVTTEELDKLMETGKVFSAEVLPDFGKKLREFAAPGIDKALKSNRVAMNKMINSFREAGDEVFKSGFSEGLTVLFQSITKFMEHNKDLWQFLGKAFGGFFRILAKVINFLRPIISALGTVLNGIATLLGNVGTALGLVAGQTGMLAVRFKGLIRVGKVIRGVFTIVRASIMGVVGAILMALGALEELTQWLTGDRSKRGLIFNRNPDDIKKKQTKTSATAVTNTGVSPTQAPVNNILVENKMDSEEIAAKVVTTEILQESMNAGMFMGMGE